MVPAVGHAITTIIGADTLVPAGTGKLIGLAGELCKESGRGEVRQGKSKKQQKPPFLEIKTLKKQMRTTVLFI